MKCALVASFVFVISCTSEPSAPSAPEPPATPVDPAVLHAESLVIDTHIDVPYRLDKHPETDLSQKTPDGHFDFVRAKEGGLDASFFSIYVPSKLNQPGTHPDAKGGANKKAHELIDGVEALVKKHGELAAIATSPDEVEEIVASGKHAICLGMENGAPIEGDLAKLEGLYERGVRYVTLTHSKDNHISDSSYDERHTNKGLTPFGRDVVKKMNELGMLIDISHVSDDAFMQVLELSKSPVIATHSSLRTFRDMERNVSDDMLKALAKNGGVLHINFGTYFLRDDAAKLIEARSEEIKKLAPDGNYEHPDIKPKVDAVRDKYKTKIGATLEDVVAHIDHAVKLVGADHVGLGSDFDGVGDVPRGLDDVSKYPALTRALFERGYSPEDIKKINGGNLLRVWRENEKRAKGLVVASPPVE